MPGLKVPIQLIQARSESRGTLNRVWATHPARRFPTKVMKPGKVTDGTYVITIRSVAGPSVPALALTPSAHVAGAT